MFPCVLPPPTIRISKAATQKIEAVMSEAQTLAELEWEFNYQDFARAFIPELYSYGAFLRFAVEQHKAVVVPCAFLQDLSYKTQQFLCLTLGFSIGRPTATDKRDRRIVWEVKSNVKNSEYSINTISQTNDFASLHTDSAYRSAPEQPEKLMALLCISPSRDGGGCSLLMNARHFIRSMLTTEEGRACAEYMKNTLLPFATPREFRADGASVNDEVVYGNVISDKPFIRYRYDVIKKGIELTQTKLGAVMSERLETFQHFLDNIKPIEYIMKKYDMLICDNHEVMHGRTAFSDLSRMLLRMRMD